MVEYKFADISLYEYQIKEIFKNQPFGRFLSDREIKIEDSINYEWIKLLDYAKKGSFIVAVDDSNNICGFVGFHFSEWDTDVFDKQMAILKYFIVIESNSSDERTISENLLKSFHDWAKDYKIQVVVTKLDTKYFSPIYILQKNGYIFYETLTFQTIDVDKIDTNIGEGIKYRFASKLDKEKLKKMSLESTFKKSHFYLDPNFSVEKINLMYAKWIDSALNSDQKILIIEENNQIAGAFIYDLLNLSNRMNKNIAVWKSVFLDKSFRNKGLGLKLFKATMQAGINDGVNTIDSELVEKNIISQSFHNKLGFRLVNTFYTFHKWFD